MFRIVTLFTSLILALLLAACSDENEALPPGQVHPVEWSAPEFSGMPVFHGTVVLAETRGDCGANVGSISCRECHGLDLLGSATIPGCSDCHDSLCGGHGPGWLAIHGLEAIADFQRCKLCHGENFLGGIGPGCDGCHPPNPDWPHPPSSIWLNPDKVAYHGNSAEPCLICHGDEFLGGSTGVGCFTCHFDETGSRIPPGSGWIHGTDHDHLAAFGDVCNTCHDTVRRWTGRLIPPNGVCHDCHGVGLPHGLGATWVIPSQHAQTSIDDLAYCQSCHFIDTAGTLIGPSCRSCHLSAAPPTQLNQCYSCHGSVARAGTALAGYPNGSTYPNRQRGHDGSHDGDGIVCSDCHSGFGTGTLNHWFSGTTRAAAPADVNIPVSTGITYVGGRCAGTCHKGNENHGSPGRTW